MNMDSHKIFQAYVLAKRIDNKQLNEGIAQNVGDFLRGGFDLKKGQTERMDKRRLESYMGRWLRYWYPRFSDKGEVETDTPKASEIFRRFLDSENWGEGMNQNVDKALDYFEKNHNKIDFKDLEKNAIETLIYGAYGSERLGKEKVTKLKSSDSKETSDTTPDTTSEKTPSVSLDDYKKNSETINKGYAKPDSTSAPETKPEPEPETASETPEDDTYKLKAEITRLKNNNSNWIKAIKRKFGRSVTKPSDLAPSKAVASKAAPKTKKSPLKK